MKARMPLSSSQRKAMNGEINRQIAENDAQYAADIDALILYVLHARYGWGKKRLKMFWNAFNEEHRKLREHYQMDAPGDNEWLAHQMLKEIGVDIHQWYKGEHE